MTDQSADVMGGFKDARTFRQEALSARSYGQALLGSVLSWMGEVPCA